MNGFVSSCPGGRIECGGRPGLLASDPGQCLWRERPRFEQRRPKKMNQPFLDNESAVFGCTANFKRPIDSTAATVEEDRRRQRRQDRPLDAAKNFHVPSILIRFESRQGHTLT